MGGSTLYVEAACVETGEGKGSLRTTGHHRATCCSKGMARIPNVGLLECFSGDVMLLPYHLVTTYDCASHMTVLDTLQSLQLQGSWGMS